MAKLELNKLPPNVLGTPQKAGLHSDGGGLYLVVDKSGAKRWAFVFRWDGKRSEMGLGGAQKVSLSRARSLAATARDNLGEGLNPIEVRKADQEIPTFGTMADEVVKSLSPSWRNAKHKAQWEMTLTEHAKALRTRRVNEINTQHVLDVLKPLADRAETAARLRGRIERVLDAARAKGHIRGPWANPAAWKGNLAHLLPGRGKLSRGHHKALPFVDVPAFLVELRSRDAMAALALEFAILTAARTSEVLAATWGEVDLKGKIWTVPAGRMKAAKEHRVPLSPAAIAILTKVGEAKTGELIFPGPAPKKRKDRDKERPLSTNAFRALLGRMEVDTTPHGFRSSFRDWCGEASTFPRELAEQALAHVVGDDTERAYRRGDALERRRKMMEAWANYCAKPSGSNITNFGKRRAS